MTPEEEYEQLIEKHIEKKELTIAEIIKESEVEYPIAERVYLEWKSYHDEVFWHNCIYEISFMDEVITPFRISRELGLSLYFSIKLFNYYMEII